MTPALESELANKQVLLGGCVVGSKGGFGVICTTCGCYTFHGDIAWQDERGNPLALQVSPDSKSLEGTARTPADPQR